MDKSHNRALTYNLWTERNRNIAMGLGADTTSKTPSKNNSRLD